MSAPVYLSHPSSLEHDTGPHPERAERIVAIERELQARGWLGFERVVSAAADIAQLTSVHEPAYVESLRRLSEAGGGHVDADTVVSRGSFEAALHGAGGAAQLVDRLLAGAAPAGISAHRPPGHHAGRRRAMGFCLFNNVAVAAAHALQAYGLERVLILDWDVHHGNGTNDIFHSSDQVLYASIHEHPLYPGTGPVTDQGSGAGVGYTVNLPVPPGAGDDCFASLVEHVVAPIAREYGPQLILVSAGFDAHVEDPLADCLVSESGYQQMTRSMRRVAAELRAPLGIVLEGGYALGALSRSVAATLEALVGEPPAGEGEVGPHPLAVALRERVSAHWRLPAG
jgi:acetoin utilization deacetylase AcuC-like enzyme